MSAVVVAGSVLKAMFSQRSAHLVSPVIRSRICPEIISSTAPQVSIAWRGSV